MIILCLAILTLLLWIGYHITGALLAAIIWLCIKLPCAIIVCCFGIVCCVLILLLPVGLRCFRCAWNILTYTVSHEYYEQHRQETMAELAAFSEQETNAQKDKVNEKSEKEEKEKDDD